MPRKGNKDQGAIHRLMQDLIVLQGRQGGHEDENQIDSQDGSNARGGRRYQDKLAFTEQVDYYQQKLDSLKRAEKLDALLSHSNLLLDFNPKELVALTKSLKSSLAKFEQNIHHVPDNSDKNDSQLRKDLDQIQTTLGVLSQDFSQMMEMVSADKEHKDQPDETAQLQGDISSNEGDATPGASNEEERPPEPVRPELPEPSANIPKEQIDPVTENIPEPPAEHEVGVEEESHDKEKSETKQQVSEELRKQLNQVYEIIEKRSALMETRETREKGEEKEPTPPAPLPSAQTPPTPAPEVAEEVVVASTPAVLEKDSDKIAQDLQALKSTMEPLESLSFEQYLSDLRAYDPQNRLFAVQKLGEIRRKELAGILLYTWEKESDNSVRSEIITALVDMGYDDVLGILKKALLRPDPKIVVAALEGLYRFRGKDASEEFVKALGHSHHSVRRRAATYLGWMEAEWAIPDLVKLLRDPNIYNRKVGIGILSKFKVKKVIFFFIEMLNDPDQGVREAVIKALIGWTGHDMGYDPKKDDSGRLEAVSAWKQWWEQSEAGGFEFKAKTKSVEVKEDIDARGEILAALEKQYDGLSLKEIGQKIGAAWQGLTGIVKGLCQEDILVKKGNVYFLAQQ